MINSPTSEYVYTNYASFKKIIMKKLHIEQKGNRIEVYTEKEYAKLMLLNCLQVMSFAAGCFGIVLLISLYL